jgi:cytochrome c553
MRLPLLLALLALVPATAEADGSAGEAQAQSCRHCHRVDNPPAWIPTLEGQTREYLYNQLKAYGTKRRPDPWVQQNVAPLSDQDMRDIAGYFASRKPVRGSFRLDAERIESGRTKAGERSCATCHGADYGGNKDIPRLAGMVPQYVSAQILAFIAGKRPHPRIEDMKGVSREDAEDLAQYFAHLD